MIRFLFSFSQYDIITMLIYLIRRKELFPMKRFKSLKDHVYDYIETQIKEGK